MTHGSLFSGIGGFDLAAEWMGWENVFHCEWNEFGQQVLKHYWPKAISYEDITKTDFTIHRGRINILTGGFPCQPYSSAGKRLGKEDDRHLWPEMLRAIREIQPCWVVGENVRGIINWNGGMVFDEVQADMENEGYEVLPFLLPACGVNAPHRRDRIWFVANSNSERCEWGMHKEDREEAERFFGSRNAREAGGAWENFPTQSPIHNGDDGFSSKLDGITFSKWRNESIKAGGNAIVPQVVLQIFKAIEQYENTP
jgi:DNA (cytosine-5)-methyltransferase 1